MAGVTVGVASGLAPAAADEAATASATTTTPEITTNAATASPDALATCDGATKAYNRDGQQGYIPTVGNGTYNYNCQLSRGDKDMNGVYKLQQALNICYGLDTGGLDANFGPKTETAVNQVREYKNMTQNGTYNWQLGKEMIWPILVRDGQGNWTPSNDCARFY